MTRKSPRIALIHATVQAMAPIESAFARHWPQARCMNLLDDSLPADLEHEGELTPALVRRFVDLASYAARAGCDGILFTGSAFGPAIDAAAAAVGLPTLKPNEAMFEMALSSRHLAGTRIGLIATFEPSLPPMSAELLDMARQRGLNIDLRTRFVPGAMHDLARGEALSHHQKIAVAACSLPPCDVILLAQFSMATALPVVQAELSSPVLSSPDCAVISLKKKMLHD